METFRRKEILTGLYAMNYSGKSGHRKLILVGRSFAKVIPYIIPMLGEIIRDRPDHHHAEHSFHRDCRQSLVLG